LAVHGDGFRPEGNDDGDSMCWSGWLASGLRSIRRTTRSSRRWRLGQRRARGDGSSGAVARPDGEKQRVRCRGGHRGSGARRADGSGARQRVVARHGMVLPDVR
jgi:hypothetical protein